jgi:hypothetical protein
MLIISLVHECEQSETHQILINNKFFEIRIDSGSSGPVFTILDQDVKLQPYERLDVIKELEELQNKFVSRRIFGSYRPTSQTGGSFKRSRKPFHH